MPSTLSRVEVKRLALIGAQSRLDALNAEISQIVRAFPELSRGRATATTAVGNDTPRKGRGGRKRNWNMSDSQKRAVSERMKKYWAGRRKEKASKAAAKKA
jgi:fructose-bisphosphate aldolase class 1